MTLDELGYNKELENYRKDQNLDSFDVGRIVSEHKERYIVKTTEKDYEGEITGNLRFSANSRVDFPAVGDWVSISQYDDNKVLIHSVFPRRTIIERQTVGKKGEKQIIATNLDYAFIVQAVERDFNINRIERYLTLCQSSGVKPIIILNKIDLIDETELTNLITKIKERIKQIQIIAISNESLQGINDLRNSLEKGKTYCLLGSSGVGKSTLINKLAGEQLMKTKTISSSTNKGRHVTSHRELLVIENGGLLIDNPGMREVGIADSKVGLENTFDKIFSFSKICKFADCTHIHKNGCAVIEAVEQGEIDRSSYENFLKMEREKEHYESTVVEKRKKEKSFGKMVKNYKKEMEKNKY